MHCKGTRLDPPTVDMQSILRRQKWIFEHARWHWGAHWLCLWRFELEQEHRFSSEFPASLLSVHHNRPCRCQLASIPRMPISMSFVFP